MLVKANENYRQVIVKNEAVLTKQSQELQELKKITETSRKDADRSKEENEVLLKQNQSLVQDLANQIQDPLKKLQADRANATAIQDGKQLNPQQLKDKLRAAENALIKQKEEFQDTEANYHEQIKVSSELNSAMKEDYDMLNEQFRKHSRLQEDQLAETAKDLKNMAGKNKKLQEFFDKHDTILNEREAELQAQIIKIRNEKDDLERNLQKDLDEKKTQLETLQGEF